MHNLCFSKFNTRNLINVLEKILQFCVGSSKKVDFAEGLLVFRALMGIRTNGNLRQFSLLSEVEMGSHLLANVLYPPEINKDIARTL